MQAAVYSGYGRPLAVIEVDEPLCPPDGIIVEVGATGVCRSDWHAWQGHDPVPCFPHVPGHEYAGTVAAVGAGVTTVVPGDRVIVPFALGCGQCPSCLDGHQQVCLRQLQPGFTSWGSFAERVAVPYADANVVRLPPGVGFVEAASLGCRFATSYRAVVARARLTAGEWLAVHGCGGVGLSAVMIARAIGAHVVAVDVDEQALSIARDLGAETTLLAGEDLTARLKEATGGGAHASIDAVGSSATMRASIDSLRPLGRHVQIGLMLGDDAQAAVAMGRVLAQELEVLGSHGMPARDYAPMLDLVTRGALDPRRLVSRVISLDAAGAALEAMGEPGQPAGMTVISFEVDAA